MTDINGGDITKILEALEKEGYENILVLDREQFQSAFSKRRQEIIDMLKADEGLSISQLSKKLDRNNSAVSRDLGTLYEYNIIQFEKDGHEKIPKLKHEVVIPKPIILKQKSGEDAHGLKRNDIANDELDLSQIPDESYEYANEILDAILDLKSNRNQDRAISRLHNIAQTQPEAIIAYMPLLEDVIKNDIEVVDSVASIVEMISETHPEEVSESLYVSLLNKGMDISKEEENELKNQSGGDENE